MILNPSFENSLSKWFVPNSSIYNIKIYHDAIEGENSLKISTNSTEKGWLFVRSEEVKVNPQEMYMLQVYMKYHNMNGSHIKVEAFDPDTKTWKAIFFLTLSHFSSRGWTQYIGYFKVPENSTVIRIVLAAGWVFNPLYKIGYVEFDNVVLLPLSEVFPSNNMSTQLSYEKISPTLWKVSLNISQPSMLAFAESYDPLWVCYVNGQKIHSIPLYGVINGFYINQTGHLEITIEYEPQRWFNLGCIISLTTLLACLTYLTITHIKQKRKHYQKRISPSNSSTQTKQTK